MKINVVRLEELELERKAAHISPYETLLAQGMARSGQGDVEGVHVWVRGDLQGRAYVTRLTIDWREQLANAPLWGVHDYTERVSALVSEGRVSVFCFERDGRYFVTTWVVMDGAERAVRFTLEIQDGELACAYHGVRIEQDGGQAA